MRAAFTLYSIGIYPIALPLTVMKYNRSIWHGEPLCNQYLGKRITQKGKCIVVMMRKKIAR